MPSPRKQRDFSNINNMGKKKNTKKNKREPPKKSTNESTIDIEGFQKIQQDKRLAQLLNGTAKDPSAVVFQDTDTFQNGAQTLKQIKMKNQQSAPTGQTKLPILKGTDSETVKSSRFRLYTKNETQGRFGNALKKELKGTKDALKRNKQESSPEATMEQQQKETINQKKQAVTERSNKRAAQQKQNEEETLYEVHLTAEIAAEERIISATKLPSLLENVAQKTTETEEPPPAPALENETIGVTENALETNLRLKNLELSQKPTSYRKKEVETGLLHRFLSKIRSMFLTSKVGNIPSLVKEENLCSSVPTQTTEIFSQSEATVLVPKSELRKEQDEIIILLEQPEEISGFTMAQSTEEEEETELEPVDPLHHLRSQKPVFQGVIRNLLRESENPRGRMVEILSARNGDLKTAEIESLIDYVATPWALISEINYEHRLEFYRNFIREEKTHTPAHEDLLESVIQSREETFDKELLDILFEVLANRVILGEAEVTEIVDDFAEAYPKNHESIVLSHIMARTQEILSDWATHSSVGEYKDECINNMYYMKEKFDSETISLACEVFSAFALEYPRKIKSHFSLRKHKYSREFELRVERWVQNHLPEQKFLTETQLKVFKGERFGVHTFRRKNQKKALKNTPDILFDAPVSLEGHDTQILWIDAKLAMFDPAFTEEKRMRGLFNQMEKYAKEYGPGLMVWGKPFSEEWNENTQPTVMHTTMEAMI